MSDDDESAGNGKVDPRLTKRARGWIARARQRAAQSVDGLNDWEDAFLSSLDQRLDHYGRAFADPDKGQLCAPLSMRQGLKVRQIGKKGQRKAKATGKSGPATQSKPAGVPLKRTPLKPGKGMKRSALQRRTGFRNKAQPK